MLTAMGLGLEVGGRSLLKNIHLSMGAGERIAILGANGAGKTCLLQTLAGLRPYTGQVCYAGVDLQEYPHRKRAALRAYLGAQHRDGLPFSAAEIVAMGSAYQKRFFSATLASEHIDAVLKQVGFTLGGNARFDGLSSGEKQLVLLAQALVQKPAFYFLDEPFTYLDLPHQILLTETLRQLSNGSAAIIMAIHDLSLASRLCERFIFIKQGVVIADGTQQEVLTPPLLREAFGNDIRPAGSTCESWFTSSLP